MTDDLEPRLRRHLEQTARRVEPVPDEVDLDRRITGRRHRTTRALGAALAVALVAGPVGGWALARSTEADVQGVSSAGGAGSPSTTSPSGRTGEGLGQGGSTYGDYLGNQLELLSDRTTDDGVRLVTRFGAPSDAGLEDTGCPTDGLVRVGVTDGDLVGVVTMEVAPETALFGVTGAAEGRLLWVVVVRSDGGPVEARFPNGAEDRATPSGGVAVLAAHADPRQAASELLDDVVEITGLPGDAGTVLATSAFVAGDGQCAEPPEPLMPAPGEPPADEDAARTAITDTFLAAYDGAASEDKIPYYERSDVWWAASQEFAERGEYEGIPETIYPEVLEIVFTAPDRATVRFTLLSTDPAAPVPGEQIGEAVLIDGQWKVSIETSCALLALGGVECQL